MMTPTLYRKRLIPNECILLKDDKICEVADDHILTRWSTLRPKKILHHGESCYYLKKGVKVSRFYTEENILICWYCDIVSYEWNGDRSALTATDLLIDILVYPDRSFKILDMDELAQAHAERLISDELMQQSLFTASRLLNDIYDDTFYEIYTPAFEKLAKI